MKILAVFAHPDDEAFGPAGTLSRYALTGHSVRLATLTQGEAGTLGPASRLSRLELGRLRADELRCSARAMHLTALNIYQLPDGRLSELPAEEGLAIIRAELNDFLPDAVITFHSLGISGHPDHRTAARWCLQAIQEQANGTRLLAYGLSEAQVKRIAHRTLVPIPDDEITHVIDVSAYLEYKFRAIRCHQSQSESWERMQTIEGGIESLLQNEHFSQVSPVPLKRSREDSLEM